MDGKSTPQGVTSLGVTSAPQIFVSVVNSTANEPQASLGKRKRSQDSEVRTSVGKRPCQEPRNGTRPRVPIRVTIGVDTVDVMTLWDTGASCFVISERLVSKDGYQRVKRDYETVIHDYTGRTKPGGQFYTKPLPFSLAGKKFKEPMEVAPLREIVGYDIIIPNWWIEESGLTLGCQKGVYKVSDPEAAEPPQQPTPEPIRTGKTVGRELTRQ